MLIQRTFRGNDHGNRKRGLSVRTRGKGRHRPETICAQTISPRHYLCLSKQLLCRSNEEYQQGRDFYRDAESVFARANYYAGHFPHENRKRRHAKRRGGPSSARWIRPEIFKPAQRREAIPDKIVRIFRYFFHKKGSVSITRPFFSTPELCPQIPLSTTESLPPAPVLSR
jgi:hypothetical protein